ncbi:unnamed protein product [Bursaphelenchus okinawaensis]|uniref:Uncharacterized protein n=1 Tax=Bursaphelenchus okinawaensis TaxID=465554 RepID=A0A811K493_9BILA|nr:unnamed protein product [Bursaphelenchus okinawaensis]CAG9091077.1 unnamed protein product [Bursaphelenchus okinawaensis]
MVKFSYISKIALGACADHAHAILYIYGTNNIINNKIWALQSSCRRLGRTMGLSSERLLPNNVKNVGRIENEMFGTTGRTIHENCSRACDKLDKTSVVNKNGKNAKKVVCRRCSSLIFPPNVVKLVEGEPKELKKMSVHGTDALGSEIAQVWWKTSNEMDFDTWGCQTVDGVKALMCGDCDFGPWGHRIISEKETVFYVAAERVAYE